MDRISQDLQFYQTALRVREQRQQVLATNIANADTPHFKARDFDFKQALNNALENQNVTAKTQLALTSARHIPASAALPQSPSLAYRVPSQASLDGNTVDMDVERTQFAQNTLNYQADISIISQRIKTLMVALQP